MDLPPPVTFNSYTAILKHVRNNAVQMAENVMLQASTCLINITKEEKPEDFKETFYGKLAHVAVTVDGTWQRRCHSSKTGVVFVISVRTGEILDYVVKTLFCHECVAHKDMDLEIYKEWSAAHASVLVLQNVWKKKLLQIYFYVQLRKENSFIIYLLVMEILLASPVSR